MDKNGKTFVIARANEFIYFGNFYKCQIEVAKGEKWEIIHQGGSFTVLKRGKVTIELCSQDFPRYFEQHMPGAGKLRYIKNSHTPRKKTPTKWRHTYMIGDIEQRHQIFMIRHMSLLSRSCQRSQKNDKRAIYST